MLEIRGREMAIARAFEPKENIFTELEGFGPAASDYGFEMENRATGAGVRASSDRPLAKLVFWSAYRTVCPEPYVDASVEPGRATSWRSPTRSTRRSAATPPRADELPPAEPRGSQGGSPPASSDARRAQRRRFGGGP